MNTFIQRCIPGLIATLTMLLFSAPTMALSGRAAGAQFKMNINISGTVVATGSCTFDSGSSGIDVIDFGNITFHSINGFVLEGNYRRTFDSAMTCTGDTEGAATMTFRDITGSGSVDFNGHKLLPVQLQPGIVSNNVAVELLVNGEQKDVGTPFNVDMASPPVLEFALVQTGSSDTVSNGATLSANGRLTMEFQ